jgi:hypothetical protein
VIKRNFSLVFGGLELMEHWASGLQLTKIDVDASVFAIVGNEPFFRILDDLGDTNGEK